MIGASIRTIEKDAQNPHHKYHYASEHAIKTAVYPKLREHGILFQLEVTGQAYEVSGAMLVPMRYRFLDAASGEVHEGTWAGSGRLGDDKGLYIAMTGALKYAITTMLGIVTGDDPEADRDVTPSRYVPTHNPQNTQNPPGDVVELYCPACQNLYPVSAVHPNARFLATWADKNGRWAEGDKVFYCPTCPKGSKTMLKYDDAVAEAHERRGMQSDEGGNPYA